MQQRQLGRSGLRVSAMGLGCLDAAVNLVDAANAYPLWHQANTARDRLGAGDEVALGA